ncbi:MAG: ATP-binding protein, partial [Nitriliruptoraceae bacterium]
EIAVTDHGDGVAQEFVPFLFDEFSQASTGDRRTTLGLGLGLALARELAQAQGGDLVLRPVPVGACFVVSLPRGEVDPSVTVDGVDRSDDVIGDDTVGHDDTVRQGQDFGP